jgi:hypothetical protein
MHIRCVERAFRGAVSPFDAHDMSVETPSLPPGEGIAHLPDDFFGG